MVFWCKMRRELKTSIACWFACLALVVAIFQFALIGEKEYMMYAVTAATLTGAALEWSVRRL
jgi:hypothetical protein